MSWRCYMVEFWPAQPSLWREVNPDNKPWDEIEWPNGPVSQVGILQWDELRAGAMWWDDGELSVKLPGGGEWNIDRGRTINQSQMERGKTERVPQWSRSGDAPNITANPSINHVGRYHGWLRDGVLTDDCEGRKFDAIGDAVKS